MTIGPVTATFPPTQVATPATIEGKVLTEDDIGRWVSYRAYGNAPMEKGILSSFRPDGAVFVRFKGPQGERCPANKLVWG